MEDYTDCSTTTLLPDGTVVTITMRLLTTHLEVCYLMLDGAFDNTTFLSGDGRHDGHVLRGH